MAAARRPGTVFIAERFDDEDPSRATGRFDAHWESDEPPVDFREGPEHVTLAEAVAWGREQADAVLVMIADDGPSHRSAGVWNPEPDELPELDPALVPVPRPEGTPADGSQQTREWRVSIFVQSVVGCPEEARRVAEAIHERGLLTGAVLHLEAEGASVTGTVVTGGLKAAILDLDRAARAILRATLGPDAASTVFVSVGTA